MRKVTLNQWSVNGRTQWVVSSWQDGKRQRRHFPSKAQAEALVAELRQQQASAGAIWLSLPAEERQKLIQVAADARQSGFDLAELLAEAKKRPSKPVAASVTLSAMMSEMFAVKRAAGASERYLSGLAVPLRQFMAGREELPVASVQFEEVERFVNSVNPASRSTVRGRLSTLFNFCVRRGHLLSNPCARMERMNHQLPPVAVFTVEQVKTCLDYFEAHPRLLAWFALTCFCGLRPEEADKSKWSAIDFAAGLSASRGKHQRQGNGEWFTRSRWRWRG